MTARTVIYEISDPSYLTPQEVSDWLEHTIPEDVGGNGKMFAVCKDNGIVTTLRAVLESSE